MQNKNKLCAISIVAFLVVSLFLLTIPTTNAATPIITLTPTAQAPLGSVNVAGTSFAATSSVGIGFGEEVAVTGEIGTVTGTGLGPYTGTAANKPIKPGTFLLHVNINNGLSSSDITDAGTGTLTSTAATFGGGTINYVTGQYVTYSTIDPSSFTIVRTLSYTRYQYSVSSAGLTTDSSGAFTSAIIVPNVVNGAYNVLAIDTQGNSATSSLTVNSAVPEGLSIVVMVLLSSIAAIISTRYFRKPSKILSHGSG
jgi:hypothetical protein